LKKNLTDNLFYNCKKNVEITITLIQNTAVSNKNAVLVFLR